MALGVEAATMETGSRQTRGPFVGLQISPISLIDEGVEEVLEFLRHDVGVNALFLACHSFSPDHIGRAGENLPDHGSAEPYTPVGGSYFTPHGEYYRSTVIPPFRAPDPELAGVDILAAVLGPAQQRGMAVYAWLLENPYDPIPSVVPNWVKVSEVDCFGTFQHDPCLNNPDYRNWWLGIVEDVVRSYPIEGVMWGSERLSPFVRALAAPPWLQGPPVCFCAHCADLSERAGIDVGRASEGYRQLWALSEKARNADGTPPSDGWFVTFWRHLLEFPEILAWERQWSRARRSFRGMLYGAAKAVRQDIQMGWHLWHLSSYDPFFRALNHYREIAGQADFVKPVLYDNAAGIRFERHMERLRTTLFREAPSQVLTDLLYSLLQVDEAPAAVVAQRGWSSDYVYRETRRAVVGTGRACRIYAGIGIDIPSLGTNRSTHGSVRAAIDAARRGGADGVVLSRQYCEMFTANLRAAGEAVAQWEAETAQATSDAERVADRAP